MEQVDKASIHGHSEGMKNILHQETHGHQQGMGQGVRVRVYGCMCANTKGYDMRGSGV